MSEDVARWFLRAHYRYVWDKATIADYIPVLINVMRLLMSDSDSDWNFSETNLNRLVSPDIGLVKIGSEEGNNALEGYALYVSNKRSPHNRRYSLFAEFKQSYKNYVFGDHEFASMYTEKNLRNYEHFFPNVDAILEQKRQVVNLVKDFSTLANKSLNHFRGSKRLRYQVLQRDKFTCRDCGRNAPAVRLQTISSLYLGIQAGE